MLRTITMATILAVSAPTFGGLTDPDILLRGDANADDVVDVSDVLRISAYLQGSEEIGCLNSADVDDDGSVSTADASYLANWLFNSGPVPPHPGPYGSTCVVDEAPSPGCEENPCS